MTEQENLPPGTFDSTGVKHSPLPCFNPVFSLILHSLRSAHSPYSRVLHSHHGLAHPTRALTPTHCPASPLMKLLHGVKKTSPFSPFFCVSPYNGFSAPLWGALYAAQCREWGEQWPIVSNMVGKSGRHIFKLQLGIFSLSIWKILF